MKNIFMTVVCNEEIIWTDHIFWGHHGKIKVVYHDKKKKQI